jgi:hypothetical protein
MLFSGSQISLFNARMIAHSCSADCFSAPLAELDEVKLRRLAEMDAPGEPNILGRSVSYDIVL